jgi:hypothetical protein
LKTIKITLASLLALAFTNLASAQTVLHITGSTAYRAATLVAISEILQPGYQVAYVASSSEAYTKANMVIFIGTTNSGVSVEIKTAFFGSIGGVCNVAGGLTIGPSGTAYTDGQTIGWLSDSNPTLEGSVTFSGGVYTVSGGQNVASGSAVFDTATVPDCTMSDSFQAAAPTTYQKPVLSGEIVGVVPFVWICAPGTTASTGTVSNLTSKNAIKAFDGTLLLSDLSGKKGDKGVNVYLVGRDQDSGTRVAAITDTGFGAEKKGTIYKDVMQYQPLYNGATEPTSPPPTPSGNITGAALWPATGSVDSIDSPLGDSGYDSGSLVGESVEQVSNFTNWLIAYVGLNDGVTALGNANNFVLEFNGGSLTYSGGTWDVSGVEGGSYAFWGYEHLLYLSSLTGNQLAIAQEIGTEILTATAPVSGVEVSSMTVHREYDGGKILSGGNPPSSP